MSLRYVSHYFNDPMAKESFERYAIDIFNLDFSRWKERGLWDERYVAFSAFEGNQCVSSMCVYLCDLIIEGIERKCIQLLTVGTLKEYRKRGIQRRLWSMIHDHYSPKYGAFLFTDDSAAGFYEKIGFKRIDEYTEIARLSPSRGIDFNFVRLNMDQAEHYEIAYRISKERSFVSNRLGFRALNLLMFMFLYFYRNSGYYLPDLDCIVIVEDTEDRLRIHDIIAKRMPVYKDLEDFFCTFKKREIEFLFHTDQLDISVDRKVKVTDSILLVDENISLPDEPIFPYSIRA